MDIRPATIDDIPNLVRLVNSAYRGEGGWTGEVEPFHAGDRFGTQKQPLELAVLAKTV